MAKISVIIPVYNVEKYLAQCLDSVLNQTFKDIEIICIDDGSTDGSVEILNKYSQSDERIKLILQDHAGVSVARNVGMKVAEGEFITFVDSDDYLLSVDYLKKLYNACEKYNADISVAGIIRGNGRKTKYLLKIDKEEIATDYKEKLRICGCPNSNYVWNKLYRRITLLNSKIFFPPGVIYEDLFFTPKVLFYLNKLVSIPDVAYYYRKRSNSIIKNRCSRAKYDKSLAEKQMCNFLKAHNIKLEELDGYTKKIKLFGITFFKTSVTKNLKKNALLNFIRWQDVVKQKVVKNEIEK